MIIKGRTLRILSTALILVLVTLSYACRAFDFPPVPLSVHPSTEQYPNGGSPIATGPRSFYPTATFPPNFSSNYRSNNFIPSPLRKKSPVDVLVQRMSNEWNSLNIVYDSQKIRITFGFQVASSVSNDPYYVYYIFDVGDNNFMPPNSPNPNVLTFVPLPGSKPLSIWTYQFSQFPNIENEKPFSVETPTISATDPSEGVSFDSQSWSVFIDGQFSLSTSSISINLNFDDNDRYYKTFFDAIQRMDGQATRVTISKHLVDASVSIHKNFPKSDVDIILYFF